MKHQEKPDCLAALQQKKRAAAAEKYEHKGGTVG
jgi:hypothetical protein